MTPSQPTISIVVPVYNVENYIYDCVNSILSQTFRDFEVILVDDESPDNCPLICDRIVARYNELPEMPSFRVIHKKNAGLGMARNTGIEAAKGRYVLFLDSDDTLRRDALETLYNVILQNPDVQVVHGKLCRFVELGLCSANVHSGVPSIIRGRDKLRRAALCCFAAFPGDEPYALEQSSCGALYDMELLRRYNIRYPSERQYISEDYIFNFEVASRATALAEVPDTIYEYRINPLSLTHSAKEHVMQRVATYCKHIEELMLNAGYGSDAAKYAFGYAASSIRAQYKYMFMSAERNFKQKMQKVREWRHLPYFERMVREFDPSLMSRLHRLNYALFRTGSFHTLYALIKLQQQMRRLKGTISD
ncbi:MAG: glycosyltransferase family 2 protein [Muribaculaceae bacterium]|nr:glycosyltransferase family 2 protein [Muribaculaceae bacterium]